MLRDVDELLAPAVAETVEALDLGPADAALVTLAMTQARAIDAMDAEMRARMIGQVSGALLATLRELAARAVAGEVSRPPSRLQALREARRDVGGVAS